MSNITIHSDGTPSGTVVFDGEGNKIEGVTEVTFTVEANGLSTATIYLAKVQAILESEQVEYVFQCPECSEMHDHRCKAGEIGNNHTAQVIRCDSRYSQGPGQMTLRCVRPAGHLEVHICSNGTTW
jgi:predicted RNA-binding Zn-ribbon protein involved in translation (DUF1610 family)